jgi:hypothetical protein
MPLRDETRPDHPEGILLPTGNPATGSAGKTTPPSTAKQAAIDLVSKLKAAGELNKFSVVPIRSPPLRCDTPWDSGGISSECPTNPVQVGGGCEFTCFQLDHTVSIPSDKNGWNCRAISKDAARSYSAVALCLRSE